MSTVSYLVILCISMYTINNLLAVKRKIHSKKIMFLALIDGIFLIGSVSVLMTNYFDLLNYWWLLIILGLPSLYYQFLMIKKNGDLDFIKFINFCVTIILIIVILLKI